MNLKERFDDLIRLLQKKNFLNIINKMTLGSVFF